MTLGFVISFGGVILFGILGSIAIYFLTREARRESDKEPSGLLLELDTRLAEAANAAQHAATEIEKVRAQLVR